MNILLIIGVAVVGAVIFYFVLRANPNKKAQLDDLVTKDKAKVNAWMNKTSGESGVSGISGVSGVSGQ